MPHPHQRTLRALCLLPVVAFAGAASAQWTTDPAAPTVLASGTNDQVQPKLVRLADGGFYISWLDNAAGGYDPVVQRYSAGGLAAWPAPVKAYDTSFSSTEDYGLTVDAAGNAVLVNRDDRFGSPLKITAQAIAPDGSLLWGANGVQMPTTGDVYSPKAGRAGDGAAVVGWSETNTGNRAKVLRLNPNGTPAWAAPFVMADTTTGSLTTFLSDIQPGDGDSVIASCVRYTTFTGAKTLQAQKLNGAGAPQWGTSNLAVFTSGSLQFGNYPTFVADGNGGAVFSWYTSSPLQCLVQWVSSSGTRLFATGGLTVATGTSVERVNPSATVDPVSRRIYVSWVEHIPNSSIYGAGAQAIDGSGARLWDPIAGLAIAPQETVYQMWQPRASMLAGKPVFTWTRTTSFGSETTFAQTYSDAGTALWPAPVALTGVTSTGRWILETGGNAATTNLLNVWETGAIGTVDIVGCRLNADGTLGVVAVPGDVNGDGKVNGADLGAVLGAFGPAAPGAAADFDHNGVVDGADLGFVLGRWAP